MKLFGLDIPERVAKALVILALLNGAFFWARVIQAAGVLTLSYDLSQGELDALDAKVIEQNLAQPSPNPSPWVRQSVFNREVRRDLQEMRLHAQQRSGAGFCRQWNNTNSTPACSNPSPASGPIGDGVCSFTQQQKNILCDRVNRPAGCDLCQP